MDLKFLLQDSILKGSTWFFKEILDITIAPAATSEIDLSDFLKEYLTDTRLLGKVADARLVGMINDLSLEGKRDNGDAGSALYNASDDYDMLLVFGVQTKEGVSLTRTDITRLTRALNRRSFNRPVVVLFRYNGLLSFAAAERGQFKRAGRQGEKIGRISILRDIRLDNVHAGHERILLQLRINPLKVTSFKELYEQWQEVFNVSILNREFYTELFTWYLWAVRTVSFPNLVDDDKDDTVYNSENVIRLLTRLIFCWFVKEKALVPDALFDKKIISETLKNFDPDAEDDSCYYKAILQNLFFATLNTEMPADGGGRVFIDDNKKIRSTGYTEEYLDHLVFRYENLFKDPEQGIRLFENIPFLNGGLFECLDRRDPETNAEIRIDGFSSKPKKQPIVPNVLFFGKNDDLDLSDEFENGKKYRHCKARGIINILNSYKFTIEENTPLEQEIALDPELLGRIFENLLASYNPETRTTARKQTGSYYTPREIVNYMVDESLIAYLKTKLTEKGQAFLEFGKKQTNIFGNEGKKGQLSMQVDLAAGKWHKKEEKLEAKLRELFAYETDGNPFEGDEGTTQAIIAHLSECKILDPACGSGAFPMGILHKMVFALGKLDPYNFTWKQAQLEKAQRDKQRAKQFEDESLREAALKSAENKIKYIEESFGETGHELDYTRKLFLIENCIYGVDIQQIAVQISKLRFFISLMVDQRVDDTKPNRNILSLPNLETKFVAANTLIPIEKPKKEGQMYSLIRMDDRIRKIENELHEIRQRIFFTKKWTDKKTLKRQEYEKRKELLKELVESGFPESSAGQVASWDPFDPLHFASFFDPEIMFAIEGDRQGGFFDIVIGNPPYIKEYTHRSAFDGLHESDYYVGKMDIWYFFACKGIDFLRDYGLLTYIATNNWVTNFGAKKLRNKVLQDTQILQMLDFNDYKVFETSDIQTMVMLFQRLSKLKEKYFFDYRWLNDHSFRFDHVIELLEKHKSDNNTIFSPVLLPSKYIDRYVLFSTKEKEAVLTKLLANSNFCLLENGDKNKSILPEIAQGIVAPQETLNKDNLNKLNKSDYSYSEGIFLLKKSELGKLKLNDFETKLIKPYYTSKQLHRYFSEKKNELFIIYTDSRFKGSNLKKKKPPVKISAFPNLKDHLDRFKKVITSDNKPYGLHRAREQRIFEGEKILALRKSTIKPTFIYNGFDCFVSQTYNIIKTNRIDNKFLIAILNSTLITFWLNNKGKMQGSNFQLDNEPLSQLPLIKPDYESMIPFIGLINLILERKFSTLSNDTNIIESNLA